MLTQAWYPCQGSFSPEQSHRGIWMKFWALHFLLHQSSGCRCGDLLLWPSFPKAVHALCSHSLPQHFECSALCLRKPFSLIFFKLSKMNNLFEIKKKKVIKYNLHVLSTTFPVAPRCTFCRPGWSLNLVRSGLMPWNKACLPDNHVWIANTVLFCLVEWKFGTKPFSQVPNHCRTLSGGNLNSKAERAQL